MENASKAIIMAGGILIALIIVSLIVMIFGGMGELYSQEGENLTIEQLEKFNRQFATYDRSLYGSELLSLANLISDYDNRLLLDADQAENFYRENKFEVVVLLDKETIGYDNVTPSYTKLKSYKKGCDISLIKEYNDALENRMKSLEKSGTSKNDYDYQDVKSSLTQLRSMPFRCTNKEYNKYGRISKMTFNQVWDNHIEDVIKYPK